MGPRIIFHPWQWVRKASFKELSSQFLFLQQENHNLSIKFSTLPAIHVMCWHVYTQLVVRASLLTNTHHISLLKQHSLFTPYFTQIPSFSHSFISFPVSRICLSLSFHSLSIPQQITPLISFTCSDWRKKIQIRQNKSTSCPSVIHNTITLQVRLSAHLYSIIPHRTPYGKQPLVFRSDSENHYRSHEWSDISRWKEPITLAKFTLQLDIDCKAV